jgi:Na+-driven multidrug efflux pump
MFSANLILTLLTIIFSKQTALLFTDNTKLVETVAALMPVFLSGMTVFGLQRACQNTFIALGQAKVSLFIALLRKVILLIPLALILPRFMGVIGIYTAEAVADATAATICTCIFAVKFPKILKKRALSD